MWLEVFKMSAEAIHWWGQPKKHNLDHIVDYLEKHLQTPYPYYRRYLFDSQGTQGDFRTQGSGNVLYNWAWYLVLNTGVDVGLNYIYKSLAIPETLWMTQENKEVESAICNRDGRTGQDACFMLCSGLAGLNNHQRATLGNEYCAFWMVGSGTYRGGLMIYARTQDGNNFQETQIEGIGYPERRTLRIEFGDDIKYYVNNVLKATHSAYSWGDVGPPYVKEENANNAEQDASIIFYFVRMLGNY